MRMLLKFARLSFCSAMFLPVVVFCWNDSLVANIETIRIPGGRVDWCGANGLIAFDLCGTDTMYDLWIRNIDGSEEFCLTCGRSDIPQRNIGQPTWHPSGRWIVFQMEKDPDYDPADSHVVTYVDSTISTSTPGMGWSNDLWCVDLEDTSFYRLTNLRTKRSWSDPHPITGVLHPHFSHDGRYVLYSECVDGLADLGDRGHFGLWRMIIAEFDTSGGVPTLIPVDSFEADEYPYVTWFETHGFSPDDSKIIFTANPGPQQRDTYGDICVIDLATRELTNLTPEPDSVWDEHAHFSPDGSKIIWIRSFGYTFDPDNWRRTLRTDWYMMDADGSNKVRLTYFNMPGHPEYTGLRTICSDACWNTTGDSLLGVIKRTNDSTGVRHTAMIMITFHCPVSVEENSHIPNLCALDVFPNPFNSSCEITVPAAAKVEIYDLEGNLVHKPAVGGTKIIWTPGKSVPSGIYLVRAVSPDGNSKVKRVVYMK